VIQGGTLTIAGGISDLGAGHDFSKEDRGTLIFQTANTYRGLTTIDDGILQIQDPGALGTADGSASTGTVVNSNSQGTGALVLNDPTGNGFTVANELLTLNGSGGFVGGIGALDNVGGNNTWTGNVILGSAAPNGSDVTVGVAETTSLTITG